MWGALSDVYNCCWPSPTQSFKVKVKVKVKVMLRATVPSASLSWNKALIWDLRPDRYYCETAAGLSVWGALSDERTGVSFTIAAGSRQRSHSRVRVPWDSCPYFIVSHSRLPFSSPRTTRRATVEVFDPASTRERSAVILVQVQVTLRLAVYRQSICLGVKPLETHDQNFFFTPN
jgi:hypothetical protein